MTALPSDCDRCVDADEKEKGASAIGFEYAPAEDIGRDPSLSPFRGYKLKQSVRGWK